jgi:hypothetical protein
MATCTDASIAVQADCIGTFFVTGEACAYLPTIAEEKACRMNVTGALFPRLWTTYGNENIYAGESFADTPHSMLVVRRFLLILDCYFILELILVSSYVACRCLSS